MPTNTAFGTLPSPTTQLFGGNAGGGSAGAPPAAPRPQAQRPQGLAPGTTPTFAQLQQQGQARPAPAAGTAPAAVTAPQQPPMLSALNTQLGQPAQPAQPPAAKRQFTPQELLAARERLKGLQDTGVANIRSASAQWGQGVAGSPVNVGRTVGGFFDEDSFGAAMGGGGALSGGTYGAGYDENGLPTATWTPTGGSPQVIRQEIPEDFREALRAIQQEDQEIETARLAAEAATRAAQPQQPQPAAAPAAAPAAPQQLPAYQSSGAFGGSSQAQVLRARLEQQLNDLSQNEAQIQGQSYAALRKAKMDEMGAEFGAQRSQLEEDLARRGLAASTIGGGRYGDLAGQQARATATFEADLLRQQAEAEAKNRQMYLSGMSELAGMAGTQDLGMFEANLKSRQADADISLRTQELQQEAALKGRELTLQEARDAATKEYQGGQLQQGYAEIGSRERMSSAEIGSRERISASDIASRQEMQKSQFGFDREQSALERGLRETMQTRELTSEERRQLNQIEANKALQADSQTFQAGQSQLERKLREDLQRGQITAEGERQLAQIEASKSLQEGQQKWQAGQNEKGNDFQKEQSQLDRDLREKLSGAEIKAASERFNKQFGLDERRFNADTDQNRNQFLATLAATLAPLDQKKRDQILIDLGIKPKVGGGVSGTTTGGGYANDTGI